MFPKFKGDNKPIGYLYSWVEAYVGAYEGGGVN